MAHLPANDYAHSSQLPMNRIDYIISFKYNSMRVGKNMNKRQQQKTPTLSHLTPKSIINKSLKSYSHQNLAWLSIIDKILQKPKSILTQIQYLQAGEWMQRSFKQSQSGKQIEELVQYYKYYKSTPLLVDFFHFHFMNAYWSRSKTIYYLKIKKILQIDCEEQEETLQKNISHEYTNTQEDKSTFYIMPQLIGSLSTPINENNNTLEKILSSLQKKRNNMKTKTITDIDKAFKFTKDQSKTKDRHSQQKSHLKSVQSNLVSHFSYKGTTVVKKKKNNHKSLSNEPMSLQRASKGKKLATANSCMNIAYHQSNLNYQRREKNTKHSQKEIKTKKRQGSQLNLNESKPMHKKVNSTEKSVQANHKSKSNKKRLQTQSNVRAAIDKTKNKIKMQKNLMLKKYVQSRQSYTKSIDSTCGQVCKHPRK